MKSPLRSLRRPLALLLAIILGAGAVAFVAPAEAQTSSVTICWRGRTMTVDEARLKYYPGYTVGACDTSPSYSQF